MGSGGDPVGAQGPTVGNGVGWKAVPVPEQLPESGGGVDMDASRGGARRLLQVVVVRVVVRARVLPTTLRHYRRASLP